MASPGWIEMRGIASQEDPTVLVAVHQQHVCRPGISSQHLGLDLGPDETANESVRIGLADFGRDTIGDGPPLILQVHPAQHSWTGRMEYPVVNCRAMRLPLCQSWCAKDEAEVRALVRGAYVMGSHCRPNNATRSITTQDVRRPDLSMFSLLVDNRREYVVVVLLKRVQRPTQTEVTRLQITDGLSQHLLNQGLGDLLPRLRKDIIALRGKAEAVSKTHHLVTKQGRAEDDILRPVHLERCHLADALCQPPATKMFHCPSVGRFGTWPDLGDEQPRLHDQALHPSLPQLNGCAQADRTTPDDEDNRLLRNILTSVCDFSRRHGTIPHIIWTHVCGTFRHSHARFLL